MTDSRLDAIAAHQKHLPGRDLAVGLLALFGTLLALFLFAQSLRTPMMPRSGSMRPAATSVADAPVTPASVRGKIYIARN